ncbi:MAG: hypothetical protein RRY11_13250 [Terrisporobacter sp.]
MDNPITKAFVEALKLGFDIPNYSIEEGEMVARAFAEYLKKQLSKE